jgi:hypothetical protein
VEIRHKHRSLFDNSSSELIEKGMDRLLRVVEEVGLSEGGVEKVISELEVMYREYPQDIASAVSAETTRVLAYRLSVFFRRYLQEIE